MVGHTLALERWLSSSACLPPARLGYLHKCKGYKEPVVGRQKVSGRSDTSQLKYRTD